MSQFCLQNGLWRQNVCSIWFSSPTDYDKSFYSLYRFIELSLWPHLASHSTRSVAWKLLWNKMEQFATAISISQCCSVVSENPSWSTGKNLIFVIIWKDSWHICFVQCVSLFLSKRENWSAFLPSQMLTCIAVYSNTRIITLTLSMIITVWKHLCGHPVVSLQNERMTAWRHNSVIN